MNNASLQRHFDFICIFFSALSQSASNWNLTKLSHAMNCTVNGIVTLPATHHE